MDAIKNFLDLARAYGALEVIGGVFLLAAGYVMYRAFRYAQVKVPQLVEGHLDLVSTLKTNDSIKTVELTAIAATGRASSENHDKTRSVVSQGFEDNDENHETLRSAFIDLVCVYEIQFRDDPSLAMIKPELDRIKRKLSERRKRPTQ